MFLITRTWPIRTRCLATAPSAQLPGYKPATSREFCNWPCTLPSKHASGPQPLSQSSESWIGRTYVRTSKSIAEFEKKYLRQLITGMLFSSKVLTYDSRCSYCIKTLSHAIPLRSDYLRLPLSKLPLIPAVDLHPLVFPSQSRCSMCLWLSAGRASVLRKPEHRVSHGAFVKKTLLALLAYVPLALSIPLHAQSTVSYRVLFGVTDTAPTRWDGTFSGERVGKITANEWKFVAGDNIDGQALPFLHPS